MQLPQTHNTMYGRVTVNSWKKVSHNGGPAIKANIKGKLIAYFGADRFDTVDVYETINEPDGSITVIYLMKDSAYRSAVADEYNSGAW